MSMYTSATRSHLTDRDATAGRVYCNACSSGARRAVAGDGSAFRALRGACAQIITARWAKAPALPAGGAASRPHPPDDTKRRRDAGYEGELQVGDANEPILAGIRPHRGEDAHPRDSGEASGKRYGLGFVRRPTADVKLAVPSAQIPVPPEGDGPPLDVGEQSEDQNGTRHRRQCDGCVSNTLHNGSAFAGRPSVARLWSYEDRSAGPVQCSVGF